MDPPNDGAPNPYQDVADEAHAADPPSGQHPRDRPRDQDRLHGWALACERAAGQFLRLAPN